MSVVLVASFIVLLNDCKNKDHDTPNRAGTNCVPVFFTSSLSGDVQSSSTVSYKEDSVILQILTDYKDTSVKDVTTSFIYDLQNRLDRIYYREDTTTLAYFDFAYGNNVVTRHRHTSSDGRNFYLSYDSIRYDLAGTSIKTFTAFNYGSVFQKEGFEYDTNGNVVQVTEYKTDGSINRTYSVAYKAGVNPYRFLDAGGFYSAGYEGISRYIPVTVDGNPVSNTYDDHNNLKTIQYTSGAESWTDNFEYGCIF